MKYHTSYHAEQKRQEFVHLRQGSRSVAEYEALFRELMEFAPDLVNTDERRCTKFEQGLRLQIRERLTMTREPDLGHLLKQAYRAEELVRFK